jgi:hypothetical protein
MSAGPKRLLRQWPSDTSTGGRFASLIDDDGNPPCDPPDDCSVCTLFDRQRPGESRADWRARITGYPNPEHRQEAS